MVIQWIKVIHTLCILLWLTFLQIFQIFFVLFLDLVSLLGRYLLSLDIFVEVWNNLNLFLWLLFLFLLLSLCILFCGYLDISDVGILLDRRRPLISFDIIDILQVRVIISNDQNGPYILDLLCKLKLILKIVLSTIGPGDGSVWSILCKGPFLRGWSCKFSLWVCMMDGRRFRSIEFSCGLWPLEGSLWSFIFLIIMEVIFGDLKDAYL